MFRKKERPPVTVPKLVRDNMPFIWKKHGDIAEWRLLEPNEIEPALRQKLVEEANEVLNARSAEEVKEELADVYDVLAALASRHGLSPTDLTWKMLEKTADRGGWSRGVYLTKFEWGPGR